MTRHYAYMIKVAEVWKPESYAEASQDAKWWSTMEEEMGALNVNNTWDLVDPPRHCKTIRCKYVYKVKYNANHLVSRYQAWLVAKRYAQTHDIDYNETFVPMVKITIVCVVLAIEMTRGCHLHQMYVKNVVVKNSGYGWKLKGKGRMDGVQRCREDFRP